MTSLRLQKEKNNIDSHDDTMAMTMVKFTGNAEIVAEEGSPKRPDETGQDEVTGDAALVEVRSLARIAAGDAPSHASENL